MKRGRAMAALPEYEKGNPTGDRKSKAPVLTGSYENDVTAFSAFWLEGLSRIDALPRRSGRSEAEQFKAAALLLEGRSARKAFLQAHAARLYRDLTDQLRSFL